MSTTTIVALAGAGVLLIVLIIWRSRSGGSKEAPAADARLVRDLQKGNYEQAAQRELNAGNLEGAFDLFLRAQKVLKAAHIAEQLGRLPEAAQLFERCGDMERAATLYRRLGQNMRADELLSGGQPANAAARHTGPIQRSTGPVHRSTGPIATQSGFHGAAAPLDLGSPMQSQVNFEPPRAKAEREERELIALMHKARAGEPEARLMIPDVAKRAVDAWMAAGELLRAAEVARAAGLVEQAVNLFANLLGEPGRAAELLSERREHQRAAELFEVAGDPARALAAWVEWIPYAADPVEHVAAVGRLGVPALERYTDAVLRAPTSRANPALGPIHQRIASALISHGAPQIAQVILDRAPSVSPHDVELRAMAQTAVLQWQAAQVTAGPAGTRIVAAEARPRLTLPAHLALNPEDLERLAGEAANRVAEKLAHMAQDRPKPRKSVVSRGLEKADVALDFANDPAVQEARSGMAIPELEAMIGGRPCDLINIEVYYRLGLACVAAGRWEEAKFAFNKVEDTSRGYRDAKRRSEDITRWQSVVGRSQALQTHLADPGQPRESRYTLLGELGRGGMAVVYRARDEQLGREVALKFMADSFAGDDRLRGLFEREARSSASLNHPNIVTVFDFGDSDGRPFICMELIEGSTIEQQLELEGRLKIVDALRVGEQVLAALEYAHDRKIMHRDVKPANMMRTKRGLVKLMDFGLAKSTESRNTTIISGTPAFMAPEQMIGRNVDGRTDLFAIGASLYQMLTGRLAFDSLRRDQPPTPLSTLLPGTPRLLEWAIHRSMEMEPDARFATAGEMRDILVDILRAVTDHARRKMSARGGEQPPTQAPL